MISFRRGGMRPGDELVMTKWAGLEGSAIIAAEKRDVLEQTLPAHLIDTAESFSEAYFSCAGSEDLQCSMVYMLCMT